MTTGDRIGDRLRPPPGIGFVPAILLAVAVEAHGQVGPGDGLAEQIGVPPREPVAMDEIAPVLPGGPDSIRLDSIRPDSIRPDSIRIDPLTRIGNAEAMTIEQGTGGRDLCDPSVPEREARDAGVDCAQGGETLPTDTLAPGAGDLPKGSPKGDPLLERRESDGAGAFDALNLGNDVPPTVILQQ